LSIAPPQSHAGSSEPLRQRRIALFGGTFDPIHVGHLAVARAAERRFHLDEIHFIPTGRPPHKNRSGMASYADRYAMVALACADHPRFLPSLAESGTGHAGREIFYSVDTVRHFKQKYHGGGVHLYFLVGADSFLHIPTWKDYETLLGLCDFIVASRPGFKTDALRLVIPPEARRTRRSTRVRLRCAAQQSMFWTRFPATFQQPTSGSASIPMSQSTGLCPRVSRNTLLNRRYTGDRKKGFASAPASRGH